MQLLAATATAAKSTAWEKIHAVPFSTWLSLVVALVVVFVLVRVWKSLREFNEFAPWLALVLVGGSVVVYWTYERTEPKVLSPVFDVLARYLPSRIQYKDAPALK